MKKEKGLALIALIIMVIVIGIIVLIGVKYAEEYLENQKKEDIKSIMLSIQGVITNISNKHEVDAEQNILIGTKIELENNTTEYIITEQLKSILQSIENADFYILNQEELNNNGVKNVHINNTEFYIVDYNSKEVIYSLGLNEKYKLSDM